MPREASLASQVIRQIALYMQLGVYEDTVVDDYLAWQKKNQQRLSEEIERAKSKLQKLEAEYTDRAFSETPHELDFKGGSLNVFLQKFSNYVCSLESDISTRLRELNTHSDDLVDEYIRACVDPIKGLQASLVKLAILPKLQNDFNVLATNSVHVIVSLTSGTSIERASLKTLLKAFYEENNIQCPSFKGLPTIELIQQFFAELIKRRETWRSDWNVTFPVVQRQLRVFIAAVFDGEALARHQDELAKYVEGIAHHQQHFFERLQAHGELCITVGRYLQHQQYADTIQSLQSQEVPDVLKTMPVVERSAALEDFSVFEHAQGQNYISDWKNNLLCIIAREMTHKNIPWRSSLTKQLFACYQELVAMDSEYKNLKEERKSYKRLMKKSAEAQKTKRLGADIWADPNVSALGLSHERLSVKEQSYFATLQQCSICIEQLLTALKGQRLGSKPTYFMAWRSYGSGKKIDETLADKQSEQAKDIIRALDSLLGKIQTKVTEFSLHKTPTILQLRHQGLMNEKGNVSEEFFMPKITKREPEF